MCYRPRLHAKKQSMNQKEWKERKTIFSNKTSFTLFYIQGE